MWICKETLCHIFRCLLFLFWRQPYLQILRFPTVPRSHFCRPKTKAFTLIINRLYLQTVIFHRKVEELTTTQPSSFFQTHWHALITAIALPRTSYASLRMYGANEIASYRRGAFTLSLPRSSPHHTHTELRTYGVNEIASYRRGASCINWHNKEKSKKRL